MASSKGENSSMITSEEYYTSLQQPNVRFQPTDQELITHFLQRKICHLPLPMNSIIDELLLDNYSPAQLSQMYEFANQKETYFFALVARKYIYVVPQHGFWKSTSPYEDIKQGTKKIGVKKWLRFYAGSSRKDSKKTNWVMIHYRIDHVLNIFVLCKVYEAKSNAKKVPDSNNIGKAAEEEVTGEQLHPRITFPLEDEYERKKRRCLSKNSGELTLARSTGTYQRPCLPELPFEVIIEILSWLPVETVLRFKCVCRQWCSLFQEDEFIAKHRSQASPVQLPYRNKWEANNLVRHFDQNFKFICCEVGLFLESTSQVFRIRNFAMHQVLYMPQALHAASDTTCFSFSSSTGECKVTCFYRKNVTGDLDVEPNEGDDLDVDVEPNEGDDWDVELGFKVITVGKDEQWRTLKLPNQVDKSMHREHGKYAMKRSYLVPSRVEGAAHVVELIRDGQDLSLEVQSLDIWSECSVNNTLPRGVFEDLEKVFVLRWNQRLAVGVIAEEALNALVLEDFKEHKWSKDKIVVPLKFLKDNPRLKNEIRYVSVVSNELVWFNRGENSVRVYNMKREIFTETENSEAEEKCFALLKPSLVTFRGMRPKKIML